LTKSINSEDLSISKTFQSFYRVPDYQREYVWGEKNANGDGGDEVEQFIQDIFYEFDAATPKEAPEYFIGTIVVCEIEQDLYDLIDGQQRTTTSFLMLCAIRDALVVLGADVPPDLASQIAASTTDWLGKTKRRMRLDLQYEDAGGVLAYYGEGNAASVQRDGTRSIRNLAGAYEAIREFLQDRFASDAERLLAFYGFFANKVKLIRIDTPSVSRALKIFETVNDRGVGLDAMDLLKNLLFMHARPEQFVKLKAEWKELTQTLYAVGEKPLRFLRYVILADYDVKEGKLREEEIYGWLVAAKTQTGHVANPLGFAARLKAAARDYARFAENKSPAGVEQCGLFGTRAVGGSATRQHYVLLLAGRHLPAELFTRLSDGIEQAMAVWLFAGVPAKDYERAIVAGARDLRAVKTTDEFNKFVADFFDVQKREHATAFRASLRALKTWHVRQFRLKYLLAKVVRHFDIEAYGEPGHETLAPYLASNNEVEHILAQSANVAAVAEFGEGAADPELVQSLGNLMLLEKSVNIVAGAEPYSIKCTVYPSSKFLLSRCQKAPLQVGINDKITRAIKRLDPAPTWSRAAVERRQRWFADVALDVWDIRRTLNELPEVNQQAAVTNVDA
jgi:hypothetical protein